MAGEKEPMGASMVSNTPAVRVLVVDDNSTSLSTTIPMLELFNYQVVVAETALEATSILRLNHESFDVVLSDLQLSTINALALGKQVEDEFHIPVILMCTNIPKGSLNVGRPFFIEKPLTPDDLKSIKQYVISRKKETQSLNNLKRRLLEEDDEDRFGEEDYASLNPKKPKLTWTTALHNKFLEAIDAIGLDRAVPKKILEYMNVPGLTRVNIASHLQKYRIYLRRISEVSGSMKHGMPDNLNESPFRSTFFWSQLHTLASNNLLLNYANSSNLETQVQGAPVAQISTSDHGEDNSNVPLLLNHPLTGLAGLSTQLGTKLNPQLNTLESSYVISPSNNFTNYTTTQDDGNPSNGHPIDGGDLADAVRQFIRCFQPTLNLTGENQGQPVLPPIDGGDLADAVRQFIPCFQPTLNLTGENQGQTVLPILTQMGGVTAKYGGEPSDPYGGLLNNLANDMTNGNMTLPEQGNPNVNSTIFIEDDWENFICSFQKEALNNNQTPENPFVEQSVTLAQVGNYIPTDHVVPITENIANDAPLIQNDAEQDMSNYGTSSGSPVVFQNLFIDNQDEF